MAQFDDDSSMISPSTKYIRRSTCNLHLENESPIIYGNQTQCASAWLPTRRVLAIRADAPICKKLRMSQGAVKICSKQFESATFCSRREKLDVYVIHSTAGPVRLRTRIRGVFSACCVRYCVPAPIHVQIQFLRPPPHRGATHVWLPPLMIVRLRRSELDPFGGICSAIRPASFLSLSRNSEKVCSRRQLGLNFPAVSKTGAGRTAGNSRIIAPGSSGKR